MKIQDLRTQIKKLDKTKLALVLVEMYKAMPKKVIEGKEIDELIHQPNEYIEAHKKRKSAPQSDVDVFELETEIEQFISDAKAQNYFAPNRVIPKKQRPKWRFLVKRYVNELQVVHPDEDQQQLAAELLEDLYKLLCQACGEYLFSTDDPFRSVGITQVDFYDQVIRLKRQVQPIDKFIEEAISLIIDQNLGREGLHTDLMDVLQALLHTPPLRETALDVCKSLLLNQEQTYRKRFGSLDAKKSVSYSPQSYRLEGTIQNLTTLMFRIHMSLFDEAAAVRSFQKHYWESNAEVKLYILLQLLQTFDRKDRWIQEYEDAWARQVKPRESLSQSYETLVQTGAFRQYF